MHTSREHTHISNCIQGIIGVSLSEPHINVKAAIFSIIMYGTTDCSFKCMWRCALPVNLEWHMDLRMVKERSDYNEDES